MHSAQNFGANNFAMMTFFGIGSEFVIFHEKGRHESVDLSIGPFCTEFRCEQLCDGDTFWIGANFFEEVTKV